MSYQPRSTNPYIMEKKLNECVGGGGIDPSVLEEIQAEISVLGSENATMAQDIIDIKGSLNTINANLALKQPLSTILTMLTNSNIKTYEVQLNSVINTIAKLQTYISMRNFEVGTEVISFKLSNSSQFFGLMVSNSPSSTLTSGMFFGYDYNDVAFFSKNNDSVTIYHLNKTKKYPAS